MLVATYDLAIIEDYLAGFAKSKISIKKQNGVVVIFGEPWQLLLTGSAVPRIAPSKAVVGLDLPIKALSMHIQKPYKGKIV